MRQLEVSTQTSDEGVPHVYQIMLGTPEAAEVTEQTGTFLRARVH
jgi:monoterpene epsilon-lactone hydrolase